ncbi:hypothetical protein O3S80_11425 [Streptomyces sp. Lzd4kr]|nr:hypothetical protein [Streptomyces sp. Lzd4kr]
MALVPKTSEVETLRRTSFKILSWLFTFGFGGVATGLVISLWNGLERGPLIGVAACLGVISLTRRIMGSRIILGKSSVIIVNPLAAYIVPYVEVAQVGGGDSGTLTIITRQGNEIYSTGFGGSFIDHFVGSTGRAAERIEARIKRPRRGVGHSEMKKQFTVSWIADFCTVGVVVCGLMAAVVGV